MEQKNHHRMLSRNEEKSHQEIGMFLRNGSNTKSHQEINVDVNDW